jgi:hypothetical protein
MWLSPSDCAEDAVLLGWASAWFLSGEDRDPLQPAEIGTVDLGAASSRPLAAGPFREAQAAAGGEDAAALFERARDGEFGSYHAEVARLAGTATAWSKSLAALGSHTVETYPPAARRHDPPLPPVDEDLKACAWTLIKKLGQAFKIGFGLWGRWERA